jgi:adenosine deaminase CECR1
MLIVDFSNSVSHEFYQVMVGSPTMSIHGWRQLVEWSVQYSCLSVSDQVEAGRILAREWEDFCQWIVDQYGEYAQGLNVKM